MSINKNIVANSFGQAWTAVMSLAFLPLFIHYLGVAAYGLVGAYTMLQTCLTVLDIGMTPTLSREMARFTGGAMAVEDVRDLLRSIELLAAGVACLVALCMWGASGWLASVWLHVEELPVATVAQAIAVMGLVLALRFVEGLYRSVLIGLQRQVAYNAIAATVATLRWAGAVAVLAWFSRTIQAFFLWQGAVAILSVAALAGASYRYLPGGDRRGRFSGAALKRVRRFAGGMVVITLSALLLTQVDKLLLSKLTTLTAFGYYSLAASVAAALSLLATPIVTAYTPRLAELVAREDENGLRESYHAACQWVAVIVVPAALMVAIFARPALYVWTGDHDLSAQVAPILTPLALGWMLNCSIQLPYVTQLAYGWTRLTALFNALSVVLIVPFICLAVPRYGAEAAAWAWLILNVAYVLIAMYFMYRRILRREKWRWYRDALALPLAAGAAVAWTAHRMIALPESRLLLAALLVGIGVVVVLAVGGAVPAPRAFVRARLKALDAAGR